MSNIRAIRSEADYKAALARIEGLMDAEYGTPDGDELDVRGDDGRYRKHARHVRDRRPSEAAVRDTVSEALGNGAKAARNSSASRSDAIRSLTAGSGRSMDPTVLKTPAPLLGWRETRGDRGGSGRARGVAPSMRADAGHLPGLWRNVVHDIVLASRVAADACRHVIKIESVSRPPRDVVV